MSLVSLGICMLAAVLCSTRTVRPLKATMGTDLFRATFLITLTFVIYTGGVLLGTAGLFDDTYLVVAALLIGVCLRSDIRVSWGEAHSVAARLKAGFVEHPILVALVMIVLVLQVMTPIHGGDSLAYHLPNTAYFVTTHSTATLDGEMMFDAGASWAYYPRGMELIYAFFYSFAGPDLSILAFKWLLFAAVYFLLRDITGESFFSATFFVLLCSLSVVQFDLAGLKNDLALAIVVTYATVLLLETRWRPSHSWPVAFALTLALAFKSTGVLYAAGLVPLWLYRARRDSRTTLVGALALVASLGLYFYWVNWLSKGSPIYPFGVTCFGVELLPGRRGELAGTSIFANLDHGFAPAFVRGLVRRVGPVVPVLCGVGLVWAVARSLRRRPRSKPALRPAALWAFVVLWLVIYGVTPLSDRNGPAPHNQLYAGHSIRMALPAILLAALGAAPIASESLNGHARRKRRWLYALAGVCVVNLLWYDLVALVAKPENAFLSLAPVVGSFDNRILAACLIGLWAVVIAACYCRRAAALVLLIVVSASVYYGRYPDSLGYTERFKQLGQTSGVFAFLHDADCQGCNVAFYSNGSSYFLDIVGDSIFAWAGRVKNLEKLSQAEAFDLLIVGAAEQWVESGLVRGADYNLSLDFLDDERIPASLVGVYDDAFYRIYRKAVEPENRPDDRPAPAVSP